MNTESQCKEILRYLAQGKTLTVVEAIEKFGCYALSQRCGDLRKDGWPIKCRMVKVASGKRIGQYYYEIPVAA
jgi:hypothetical protein